jgi:hypothetical protein
MFAGSEIPIISLEAELAPHATLSMWLIAPLTCHRYELLGEIA